VAAEDEPALADDGVDDRFQVVHELRVSITLADRRRVRLAVPAGIEEDHGVTRTFQCP
jgi:hypothetical protein